MLKETLAGFQQILIDNNINIKYNYIISFGSIPNKNIECSIFVATEYLSEWFKSVMPSSINMFPIVYVNDKVDFLGSSTDSIDFQDTLPICASVGGNLSAGSGTMTFFLKGSNTNDIYILIRAYVVFKSIEKQQISDHLIQPGNSMNH